MSGFNATRREGESLIIGDAVVTVHKISGRRIVLNVKAPPSTDIVLGVSNSNQRKGQSMHDHQETITAIVEAVIAEKAEDLRVIFNDETRLTAIYLAAMAATTLARKTGCPSRLANVLYVETQTFDRVLIDCAKLLNANNVSQMVSILAAEISNESVAAIVSLLEELRPRSSALIALHCEKLYKNPEMLGIDS